VAHQTRYISHHEISAREPGSPPSRHLCVVEHWRKALPTAHILFDSAQRRPPSNRRTVRPNVLGISRP
jgi:hypothetical protein